MSANTCLFGKMLPSLGLLPSQDLARPVLLVLILLLSPPLGLCYLCILLTLGCGGPLELGVKMEFFVMLLTYKCARGIDQGCVAEF